MPLTINDKVIGNHIQTARRNKHLTQAQCAAHLDVSVSYYGRLERGKVRINLERLLEISHFLEVPITSLLDHCYKDIVYSDEPIGGNPVYDELKSMIDSASSETLELMYALCKIIFERVENKIANG